MTMPLPDQPERALLPAGFMDVLPPHATCEAQTVERLMQVFAAYGYDRVKPPLIEFEETMLAGSGAALTKATFRLMDPVSQRMLALRSDMTTQIARIAETRLGHRPRPLRLSYAGQVLRVRGTELRPERQFGQVGAELVGAPSRSADVEVIVMAAEALAAVGIGGLCVDLGAPSLVPAILAQRGLDAATAARLADALDRKDASAVTALAPAVGAATADLLVRLLAAAGPAQPALEKLTAAELPAAAASVRSDLIAVADGLAATGAELTLSVDPVEGRGFEYHSGVTFSLFASGAPGELGRGGRYQTGAGEEATGVSLFMDAVLKALPPPVRLRRVLLPAGTPAAEGRRLRNEGWVTVAALDRAADPAAEARRLGCSHALIDGTVVAVAAEQNSLTP